MTDQFGGQCFLAFIKDVANRLRRILVLIVGPSQGAFVTKNYGWGVYS